MPSEPQPLLDQIIDTVRRNLGLSNRLHYEAAWTESWSHRRCLHEHRTLTEAAECAMPQGAGWYVFAVENGTARQLNEEEDHIVNKFRFGPHRPDEIQQHR